MAIPLVDLDAQHRALLPELRQAANRVLQSGRFILGPEVRAFEVEAAAALGVEQAVGVSCGTDALVCALIASGVKPGDEVVTTPFTFFATVEAVYRVGATPRFVDVDPATLCLDPAQLETACSPRTRAILPVHLFGNPASHAILDFARQRNLAVVEDAAQAFGARLPSPLGARAHSFFPAKPLGACGDAGLVTTNDPELASRCRALRVHGAATPHHYDSLGGNYRLDELQAALLRVKLPHVERWRERRARHIAAYAERLSGLPEVTCVPHSPESACAVFTVRVPSRARAHLIEHLNRQGIATAVYYPEPAHRQPLVRAQQEPKCLPVVEQAAREVLSLPLFAELELASITRVADTVRGFFQI